MIVWTVRFVSWIALPVTAVLILGRTYLPILNRDVPGTAEVVVNVPSDLVLLGFVALGIIVVHRRTGNPVGWIIAGVGVTAAASQSTIAALYSPLRQRIQRFIDRSFYRRKYDAAKTLEEFGATLRDATDLDGLTEKLTGVVRETVQPASVSLWLAPARGKEGDE